MPAETSPTGSPSETGAYSATAADDGRPAPSPRELFRAWARTPLWSSEDQSAWERYRAAGEPRRPHEGG
jgi:hypothetical protein